MAQWILNGSTNSIEWKCRAVIDLTNSSINNNQSTIKVSFFWTRARSSSYASNGATTYNITADGQSKSDTRGSYSYSYIGVDDWKEIGTKWFDVYHNADGTKSISISCSWSQSGVQPTSCSISGTVTLPTIPRASSVTCNDGNIGSATTINISRASNSFTHTLTYNFSGLTGTITIKTNQTSIGWIIPTSFYAKIPHLKVGTVTITCETYSGSTLIGTKTCVANCFVVNSNPAVSANVIDNNSGTVSLTGSNQRLIKGVSNARVTTSASGVNNATISSIQVVCGDGKSSSGADVTLYGVTSATFTIRVTDSRGFSTTVTKTLTLIDYIQPAITGLTVARVETTSPLTSIKVNGLYWNGDFGIQGNARILSYWWRESGATQWSPQIGLSPTVLSGNSFSYEANLEQAFDVNKSYEIYVRIQDKISQFDKVFLLGKSNPLLVVYKERINVNGKIQENGADLLSESDMQVMQPFKSGRDYTSGFLIKTSLPAINGTSWFLKIEGNAYGDLPILVVAQGYFYNDAGLNFKGVNCSGTDAIASIDVFEFNGDLCFWFPQHSYWQGILATCYSTSSNPGEVPRNTVWEIVNSGKPSNITLNHTIVLRKVSLV